jgi:signal transduction histidine kinase
MKLAAKRGTPPLVYFAAWTPLILLYTGIMRQTAAPGWVSAALYAMVYLAPAIAFGAFWWFKLARVIRWSQLRWPAWLALESGFAVVFSGLWHGAFYLLLWLTADAAVVRGIISQSGSWPLIFGVLVYGMHAAVYHTVRVFAALREQEIAAAEAEALWAKAEMAALRAQLDPHFLFNSLHSITALVRDDPRSAEEALLQFSGLLRRVLAVNRETTDEVSLAEEMAFVDDYLAIEGLRLGERLRITRDLSPEALACRLPVFSLQPLVENAIRHAIAPRREGGHVRIRGTVVGGRLELSVADDGPGADPAAVAQAKGVGLPVIRRRLQARYGDHAAIAIDTAPGRGFRALLTLPATSHGWNEDVA